MLSIGSDQRPCRMGYDIHNLRLATCDRKASDNRDQRRYLGGVRLNERKLCYVALIFVTGSIAHPQTSTLHT
jgi:hypothetical protein